ncbi:MAG: hypothetical protein V3Q69_08700 [Burkholderia sp.]
MLHKSSANFHFLLLTQGTVWVHCSAARLVTQSSRTFTGIAFANFAHAGARQVRVLDNLIVGPAERAQADHLTSPLFTFLTRKRSHISFFEISHMGLIC